MAIAASDDAALPAPVARDQPLTADQVYAMTARAMELLGGMASVVPDTAKLVLIKPNISIARPSGSGVVTDARVVRAVALLVHEAAPGARILIGEGAGGWVSPAMADCSFVHAGGWGDRSELIQDGFEVAGHRETVRELRAMGIDIDVHDLNFDEALKLSVPGGGLLWDEYEIARTVIDADVWINVPVAKTHGSKITCCMKNHFGIFPGTVYGWNKSRGTPDHGPIPHWPRTLDETWVDEVLVSKVDLNVVDMIQGTEGGAFEGKPKRMNLVVAGTDPIATDLVVAQLMGFNPDDFEFADLGAQRGIGPGSIDHVDVRGGDPVALRSRFAKAGFDNGGDWAEHAQYGMGPRRWTLLGPLEPNHAFTPAELAALDPVPGEQDWSPVVWFGFDKIDLDSHFDDPVDKVVYAYTRFTMAQSDSVRFWVGSDEGLTVWIDGVQIYRHEGRRRHLLGTDRIPGFVEAGEHRLLVRAEQGRGRFDFSFNICEPIDDELYAGNRYPGVRYTQRGGGPPLGQVQVRAKQSWDAWRMGSIEMTLDTDYDPVVGYGAAPDSLVLDVKPAATHALFEVIAAQAPSVAVWDTGDTVTSRVLSELPFALGYMGMGKEWWAPEQRIELGRVLAWAGLSYWLSESNGRAESSKAIAGWLARGRVPLVGHDDGWEQVAGYRKGEHAAEIYSVRPDTAEWREFGDGSWGRLPGADWLEMAVLVVEATSEPLGYPAWVDSAAAAALDLARRPRAEYEETWGTRSCPAGLAGWDAWVIEWERLPWTQTWALETEIRDRLGGIRNNTFYEEMAKTRDFVAQLFGRAAASAGGSRKARLDSAAAAYQRVAETLRTLQEQLPESRVGDISPDDSLRFAQIARLRSLPRQARVAERQALTALAEMINAEPLPPVREDPLLRRDQGRQLAHWSADLSKGVYDLELADGALTRTVLRGRDPDGEVREALAPMPKEEGWEVAIEVRGGRGLYHVEQQPAADNDWRAVIRVDDEWTDYDNATDLVVWAVPVE